MIDQPENPGQPDFHIIWLDQGKIARAAQVEYGKWIVNTLWLMHSGAIAGLLAKWDGKYPMPFKGALAAFVLGICFGFFTACLAWFNFGIAESIFRRYAYAGKKWNDMDVAGQWTWAARTMAAAIACVFLSLFCLVLGVIVALTEGQLGITRALGPG